MKIVLIISLLLFGAIAIFLVFSGRRWKKPKEKMSKNSRKILLKHVTYYKKLNHDKRELFEYKVMEFLLNCKVIGVQTEVEKKDKLMIGASAVIPIFAFPEWKYKNIKEVLLYPTTFSEDFKTKGKGRRILGMVGTGYMNNKMILSKHALRLGFRNESDKRNTAIHEFVHLIDKMDGSIDGIPEVLLEKQYVIPWVDMIEQKIEEIVHKKSDIHPYANTSRTEFFAVLSEYFFECPKLLRKKHPELYDILEEIFDQDTAAILS